jgi:hypothetical protein
MGWAGSLEVTFGGVNYDDWRLPTTAVECIGRNCTTSEMGHLYYTELGNVATLGTDVGLVNTGDFVSLSSLHYYWSESGAARYVFYFRNGDQNAFNGTYNTTPYALALHPGDVAAPVPEPTTLLLFSLGFASMAAFRRFTR